ncbi:hypothetical protein ACROYT_G028032 [Oculina patagonica]
MGETEPFLRYYYGKNVVEKVHGKRYVYQFMCDIPKILGYDPMANKCEDFVEDSVCGEPVMSPDVEDSLVTSSVEDEGLNGEIEAFVVVPQTRENFLPENALHGQIFIASKLKERSIKHG